MKCKLQTICLMLHTKIMDQKREKDEKNIWGKMYSETYIKCIEASKSRSEKKNNDRTRKIKGIST